MKCEITLDDGRKYLILVEQRAMCFHWSFRSVAGDFVISHGIRQKLTTALTAAHNEMCEFLQSEETR